MSESKYKIQIWSKWSKRYTTPTYKITLVIGHQSFELEYEGDTMEDAKWMAEQLKTGMDRIVK